MPDPKPAHKRVFRIAVSPHGLIVICAVITGFWAAAGAIGMQVPRWVWKSEFDARAAKTDEFNRTMVAVDIKINERLDAAQRERKAITRQILRGQLFAARVERRKLREAGKPVPRWLDLRIEELAAQIADLDR